MPLGKITIITPSYNQAQYIEQTIDSVLSQNYPSLEYIIIDGGSTDGSVDIIKKYKKHLAWWVTEQDKGQSHAINKGILLATGGVINWLNSDDYYEPGTLREVSEAFADPGVRCLCGRSRVFDIQGTVKYSLGTDLYPQNIAKTIGWARIDQPETFFRKSAWDKVGLLNEQLHYTMDREWWMRYLFEFGLNGIKKTDAVFVNFRLHDRSKTVSQRDLFKEEHFAVFSKLLTTRLSSLDSIIEKFDSSEINTLLSSFSNHKLIDVVASYFCLKEADSSYYIKDYQSAKEWINLVSPGLLKNHDLKLFRSLKSKLSIPRVVLNMIR